jgi:large subunit ribosomal protein LP1
MASVEAKKLSKEEHDELSCVYAALILQDEQMEITAEKLQKLLAVTGNKVEPYWPSLFAKAMKGVNVMNLVSQSAPSAPSGQPSAVAAAPKEEKKEAEKEVPKEEDAPAVNSLFDEA